MTRPDIGRITHNIIPQLLLRPIQISDNALVLLRLGDQGSIVEGRIIATIRFQDQAIEISCGCAASGEAAGREREVAGMADLDDICGGEGEGVGVGDGQGGEEEGGEG